jgi:hypothetical protein
VIQPQSSTVSKREYWAFALPFYAKACILSPAVVWVSALVIPPLQLVLHVRHASARGTLLAMAFGVGFGAALFLGMLGTAIGCDIKRNWGQSEPTVDWNPLIFWKLFLYAGSLMFLVLTFLSYRQRWWLSVEFGAFAILSWFFARGMAAKVRLPEGASPLERSDDGESTHERRLKHWAGGHLHPGFVAMEYFAVIMNRSFVIFITDDALRGWKFHGMVSSFEPLFYEPVEALLDDANMTPGSEAFEELMRGRDTFCWPYTELRSVEFINRQKWGMGPILHVGRLRIRFHGVRRQREFILLGNAHGQLISDMITSRIQPAHP